LQSYLLGPRYDEGSGMIPKEDLVKTTAKAGTQDAVHDAYIKHHTNGIFDGYSQITFKSYVQGLDSFMGTSIHVVHLDEEPDSRSIYSECLTRTMTTKGIIMCTFTPLAGLSDVVLSFIPNLQFPSGGYGEVKIDE
jgi:phage terminase large subunit-like protein